jgi:SAM-dependent methyltransferase
VAGERILDLGCGDGALTAELVSRGCRVVAVDASPAQVEAARARGLDARVMDGHALVFDAEFDAVFSNAALHWMTEPDRVLAGVSRALRPGGRFVGELGGHGCVATIVTALRTVLERHGVDTSTVQPWYFPDDSEYRTRLESAGFAVRDIILFPRPTPLPGDITDWLQTFAERFLLAASPAARARILDETRETLRPTLHTSDGCTADYVRLRFSAQKPARD